MRFLDLGTPPVTPKSRQEIRRAAIQMAASISTSYPGLRIDVDLDTVDGEDAFVWVYIAAGTRPPGLSETVEKAARRQARTTNFWIVPRIVSPSYRSDPVFRLRPRLFEDPKPVVL